ncbi:MAG: S8 family serine peptidase [Spirochaetia bacterium]|nr:S8 family serine peptidase [Spirochaetia bacterium]
MKTQSIKNTSLCKIIFALFFSVTLIWGKPVSINQSGIFNKKFAPGEVLIQYKKNVGQSYADALTQLRGNTLKRTLSHTPQNTGPIQLATVRQGITVEEAIAEYAQNANVEYAQPNYIYHAASAPNDAKYGQLWGLKNTGQTLTDPGIWYTTNNPGTSGKDINIESAWGVISDCSSVVVAVVDTGINYTQEDLAANMATGSYSCPVGTGTYGCDFVGVGTNNPMDLAGHGTHVAGTIGARGNNSLGSTGICQTAKLLAVRVLDATGSGYTSDIVEGVNFAAGTATGQGKAKIINMSLGGGGYDALFESAIVSAQSNDVVVVVAAGNSALDHSVPSNASYPCDYPDSNIICVAAADQKYQMASFSDYDANSNVDARNVDVGAPGTNIYSTYFGTSTDIITTTTPPYDDFTGWTYGTAGWAYNNTCFTSSGVGVASLLTQQFCGIVSGGTSPFVPANSLDSRVYKNFNLSAVYSAVIASFYAWIDLSDSLDYFYANYNKNGGDPFVTGSTNIAWTNGPLHTGGFVGPLSADLSACNTTTCAIGFQYKTGVTGNNSAYDGIGIIYVSITGQTISANSYAYENGTSMASPHVAGIAALVRARNPKYAYSDVVNAVLAGGDPEPAFTSATKSGNVADAYGALKYIPEPTGVTVALH